MGVAKAMDLQLGDWKGKETIEVIPLDDYDCVFGLNFLDWINALLVPFVDCICILDARYQCIVPVNREMGAKAKMLSAIQLAKGVPKEEVTYLSALKFDEP